VAQTTITVKSLVYIGTASIKNPVQISTLLFTVYLSILPIIGQTPGSTQKIPKPEPIVVTVSAQHLPLNKLSASVSIISRSEIENSQATTIVEILQHTPFVYLSRIGWRGGLSTASIRGGDANFTLIMINGIPLNDPNNILGGAFDLEALSLDRVNRIEIVRGPMSVRHGSEAIAGIINIITEKGEGKPKVAFDVLGGLFDTWKVGAQSHGRLQNWHYSLDASHLQVGEQVENEDLERNSFSINTGVSLKNSSSVDFYFRLHDRKAQGFPPNGGGSEFSILREPQRSNVRETVFGSTWIKDFSHHWGQRLHFDYYNRLEDTWTPPILDQITPSDSSQPSIDSQSDYKRIRVQFEHHWKIGSHWRVGSDLSFKQEKGHVKALIASLFPDGFQKERDIWALGGELRYIGERYQFDMGLRVDKSNNIALEASPRIGGSIRMGPYQTRLKASWAKGFKLPSFFALGSPNVGNPKLRPEKSRGFDAGIEQSFGQGRTAVYLGYYRNLFTNLIDFSPEQFLLVNRSRVKTQGMEVEVRSQLARTVQLSGHLSYLDFEIEASNEVLRDRPHWQGGIRLGWKFHHQANIQFNNSWVGPRFDFQIPVPDQDQVGGYALSTLSLQYQPKEDLTFFLRFENFLDHHFHHFIGFPDPGLYAHFGLKYRLNFN